MTLSLPADLLLTAHRSLPSPAPSLAFILGAFGGIFTTMALALERYGFARVLTKTVTVGASVGATVSTG